GHVVGLFVRQPIQKLGIAQRRGDLLWLIVLAAFRKGGVNKGNRTAKLMRRTRLRAADVVFFHRKRIGQRQRLEFEIVLLGNRGDVKRLDLLLQRFALLGILLFLHQAARVLRIASVLVHLGF